MCLSVARWTWQPLGDLLVLDSLGRAGRNICSSIQPYDWRPCQAGSARSVVACCGQGKTPRLGPFCSGMANHSLPNLTQAVASDARNSLSRLWVVAISAQG